MWRHHIEVVKISLIFLCMFVSLFLVSSCYAEDNLSDDNSSSDFTINISSNETEEETPEDSIEITRDELLECASQFSYYYRRYYKFPNSVTIKRDNENIVINRSQFIYLSSQYLKTTNNTIDLPQLSNLATTSRTTKYTTYYPYYYPIISQKTIDYYSNNNNVPSQLTIGTRKIYYQDLLEIYSEMLFYYMYTKKYPKYVSVGTLKKIPKLNSAYVDSQISKYKYRKYWLGRKLSRIKYYIKITRSYRRKRSLNYSYNYYLKRYNHAKTKLSYYYKLTKSPRYVPKKYRIYLKKTRNSQVNDPRIIAQTLKLSELTTYETAENIFYWVRDICQYTFYYNTKYGAVGTLYKKNANCIDQTHLLIAMARSAGIPAKYAHAQCHFPVSKMTVGHIWAQLYLNGRWYTVDPTSYKNTFGKQNNCKILYWKGKYVSLPF
ncbi:MAG: transglutaminase-like domain-containing protein [Methanomicrobiales archaeon]